jgi:hypothetical protein
MKKIIATAFCALTLFVLADNLKAQSIYFCESVDGDGYPISESSVFNIGSNGGYLDVLVRLPYEVACRSVRFELYRNGKYNTTIYMDTERNWVWFYKQITFYDSGTWDIDVYDCYDSKLTSGSVRIKFR